MPSVFENLAAANLDGVYAAFGLPATYTAPDGTVTTGLSVRVHRNEARQVDLPSHASSELQSGELIVREAGPGVIGGLAKPTRGGRFTVEGVEVWTIETRPLLKNGQFTCTCSRGGVERLMERRAKEG